MIKKFFGHKLWAVLAAGIAVLMLVILATGLGNVHFRPGRPIALTESRTIQLTVEKISETIVDIPLWKQVAFWGLVFLFVVIIASLFPPELRKRLIMYFLRLALFVLALFYIMKNFRILFPSLNLGTNGLVEGNGLAGGDATQAVFNPPQVPSSLMYLISLGVVLALAAVAFVFFRSWQNKRKLQKNAIPLDDLADIARSSLADISAGRQWEDVIINCYARMSAVIAARRGIQRRKDVTAAEFAASLESAGLPGEAINRLTRLFEAARYGEKRADREEISDAVACLSTVLHACGVSE